MRMSDYFGLPDVTTLAAHHFSFLPKFKGWERLDVGGTHPRKYGARISVFTRYVSRKDIPRTVAFLRFARASLANRKVSKITTWSAHKNAGLHGKIIAIT